MKTVPSNRLHSYLRCAFVSVITILFQLFTSNAFAQFHIENTQIGPNEYELRAVPNSDNVHMSQYHFIWKLERRAIDFGDEITYSFVSSNEVELSASLRATKYAGDETPDLAYTDETDPPIEVNSAIELPDEPIGLATARDPRPGFSSFYRFSHRKPLDQDVIVRFTLDEQLDLESCDAWSENWTVHNNRVKEWSMGNSRDNERSFIAYADAGRFDIALPFCVSEDVEVGSTVTTRVRIYDAADEVTLLDSITLTSNVVGSWDPNNKVANPSRTFVPGAYIEYTINFENIGDAEENGVTVIDHLPAELDPNTLELLSSSHMDFINPSREGNRFTWTFQDLPQSERNENNSHHFMLAAANSENPEECRGFLRYRVQTKQNLPVGTVIRNQAVIEFKLAQSRIVTEFAENTYFCPEESPDEDDKLAIIDCSWLSVFGVLFLIVLGIILLIFFMAVLAGRRRASILRNTSNQSL